MVGDVLIERLEHALDEANRTGEAATLRPVDLAAAISALCYARTPSPQVELREAHERAIDLIETAYGESTADEFRDIFSPQDEVIGGAKASDQERAD